MKNIIHLVLTLLVSISALAQGETKHATFRLLCMDGFITDMAYELSLKKIKVFASQSDFSPNYLLPKDKPEITFYKEVPNPDPTAPAKTIKQPLAIATLTQPSERTIILLTPSSSGSAVPYECICIPDSYETHKLETIALYNLSSKLIAVKIEEHIATVPPGQTAIAPYASKNVGLGFSVAANKTNGWEPIMSTFTVAAPNARVFAFIKDKPNASTVEGANPVIFRLVYDTQQPPEEKPNSKTTAQ